MNNDIKGFYCDFIGWTLAHTGLFHKRRLPDIHVRTWISNDIHCLMWEMILILAITFALMCIDNCLHPQFNVDVVTYIMSSSNGNIFRVTCPLWGNPPVTGDSPHKGLWSGALVFSLICAWTHGWASNRDADDLRRHHNQYDVTERAMP